jgi:methyl coenzyme M reductase subunit C
MERCGMLAAWVRHDSERGKHLVDCIGGVPLSGLAEGSHMAQTHSTIQNTISGTTPADAIALILSPGQAHLDYPVKI